MSRYAMSPDKLPKYVILVRWGTFKLDLVGKLQILAVTSIIAGIFGLKYMF